MRQVFIGTKTFFQLATLSTTSKIPLLPYVTLSRVLTQHILVTILLPNLASFPFIENILFLVRQNGKLSK